MKSFNKYVKCKKCEYIQTKGVEPYCPKCGTHTADRDYFADFLLGTAFAGKRYKITDNAEFVLGRRFLFKGWEFKEISD